MKYSSYRETNMVAISNKPKAKAPFSFVVFLICLVFIILAAWAYKDALDKSILAQEQLGNAQAQHAEVVEENKLAQQENNRRQSEDYLGQIARRDYYYSKEGEIIFHFEDENQESDVQENDQAN